MIRGIVFDKDGTLFDFRASWGQWVDRLLRILAGDGADYGAMARALGYLPETKDFRPESPVIAATAHDIAARLAPHAGGRDAGTLLQTINTLAAEVEMVEAVPLVPLFRELRGRGLRLGLATNDAEAAARAHLAAHGLSELFDFIAGYDSGFGAKPAPGMCLAFAEQLALAPADTLMVGDSLHDLDAGRAAGMRTAAVLTGIAVHDDLVAHADVVLPDIGALPGWLDAMDENAPA